MKKYLVLTLIASSLFMSSCKKCYTCIGLVEILWEDGSPTGSSIDFEYSFCEPRWKAKLIIDEYESDGYVCTEN